IRNGPYEQMSNGRGVGRRHLLYGETPTELAGRLKSPFVTSSCPAADPGVPLFLLTLVRLDRHVRPYLVGFPLPGRAVGQGSGDRTSRDICIEGPMPGTCADLRCLHCGAVVSATALADKWCEACGKR